MLRDIEIGGHAALAIDTAAEWNAGKVTMEIIGPLMVGADEFFGVTAELATEFCGAMRTAILEHIDRAVGRAHDDHGRWTDIGTDEVSGIGDFAFQGHIVPGAPVKNLFDFALVDSLIRVHPVGDARESLRRPHVPFHQRELRAGIRCADRPSIGDRDVTRGLAIRHRLRDDLRKLGLLLHIDEDLVAIEFHSVGAQILCRRSTQRLARTDIELTLM